MNEMHIKKGDTVVVISGNSKGTKGKVIEVSPKEKKVIVEKANVVSKHVKPRREGENGSIVKVESAMYACKVQLYCPDCGKGVRTHIEVIDGKKVRVCSGKKDGKSCAHKFD